MMWGRRKRVIKDETDGEALQDDLNILHNWSSTWPLEIYFFLRKAFEIYFFPDVHLQNFFFLEFLRPYPQIINGRPHRSPVVPIIMDPTLATKHIF